jgi:hypothetical protein
MPAHDSLALEQLRQRADLGLLGLGSLAVATLLLVPMTGVRAVVVLLAGLLVPGGSVGAALRFGTMLEALAVIAGLSLAIDVAISLAMVWLGWWHPSLVFAGLWLVCAALLAADFARRRARVREGARDGAE